MMAIITISRQYGSGGNEIAGRVCELLEYRYFDKDLMARVASEVGLSENEVVDFSEDKYRVRTLLERLLVTWIEPRPVAEVSTWKEQVTGARTKEMEKLDEISGITLIQSTMQAAYELGNVVIVGRGGQAILKDKSGVLHVRLEAPLELRIQRIQTQENISPATARERVTKRDRAAAAYLKRFYNINWADPLLYHLVLNTDRWGAEAAAQLIANAVNCLPQSSQKE
jgi:cytidylate kinase